MDKDRLMAIGFIIVMILAMATGTAVVIGGIAYVTSLLYPDIISMPMAISLAINGFVLSLILGSVYWMIVLLPHNSYISRRYG